MMGVYLLFYKRKLVYIGQTEQWPLRLMQHKAMKFDEVKLFECPHDKLVEYEARLIRIFKPKHNILYTPKHRKGTRITSTWIIANADAIKHSILNNDFECAKLARQHFVYSPRYVDSDLMNTIKNAYGKVFNLYYDLDINKFVQPVHESRSRVIMQKTKFKSSKNVAA